MQPYIGSHATTTKFQYMTLSCTSPKRRGFSPESIAGLKRAYRTLYRTGLGLEEARAGLESQVAACPQVREILDFLARSKRGIIR